jgi:phenylalanyl-tRNA synthetase beta chain
MKVPLSWLNEYVDAGNVAAAIARALVGLGIGVEAVQGEVLDLETTANRADLLSIRGVAREVALLGRDRKPDPPVEIAEAGAPGGVPIEVKDPAFCPRYIGRVIRGVSTGPSPAWMRARLEAAGVRPINVVADITNYVMLECGQPLHAFDLAKLGGGKIVVRRAAENERMVAIDGKEYALTPADGVIADAARPVAIAGVMGGRDSEIGPATKDVLLESASFDGASVRRTSRRLGLRSESSTRFERGVDWETVEWASLRAARLLAELAGGKPAPGAVDVAKSAPKPITVTFRLDRVIRVLGCDLPANQIGDVLRALGCRIIDARNRRELAVELPVARRDLKAEIDLIEEVARIHGYDNIPVNLEIPLRVAKPHPTDAARDAIREALVGSGAFEVVTSSFEDANAPGRLPIRNPEGHVDRTLRSSLEPALRAVLRTNEGSKEPLRPIFEIAKTYRKCEPEAAHHDPDLGADKAPFDERSVLGIAAPSGAAEARGLVERVLERLQIPCEVREGRVVAGTHEAGTIAAGPEAAVAELDFALLAALARPVRKVRPHAPHPAVTRDVSMIFEERVRWAEVEGCVRAEAGPLLARVELFDIFRDKKVGSGRKSLAFTLRFLSPDRTLAGAEIDPLVDRVRAALKSKLGGSDR